MNALKCAVSCRAEKKAGKVPWKADSSVSQCDWCGLVFNAFIRRHHCRHCGGIFCSSCSDFKHYLFKLGYCKPVRVCSKCNRYIGRCLELYFGAYRNELIYVKSLLTEKKHNPNHYVWLFPPLYMTARYGLTEMARLLIEARADVNLRLPESTSYAYFCQACSQTTVHSKEEWAKIEKLTCSTCKKEAKVDLPALDLALSTPLHAAVQRPKNGTMVELLLENKADANCLCRSGWTPLMLAADANSLPYVHTLLAHKADVNVKSSVSALCAIDYARQRANEELISLLGSNSA